MSTPLCASVKSKEGPICLFEQCGWISLDPKEFQYLFFSALSLGKASSAKENASRGRMRIVSTC